MRRLILSIAGCGLLAAGCSVHSLRDGAFDPSFDAKRTHSVAVMPVALRGMPVADMDGDRLAGFLQGRLLATGWLQAVDASDAARARAFGSATTVDPATARAVGRDLGTELACLAEVTVEQLEPTVILGATVQLLETGGQVTAYSGSGRSAKLVSAQAAAEFALESAMQALADRLK
jgi:hypothetical protein